MKSLFGRSRGTALLLPAVLLSSLLLVSCGDDDPISTDQGKETPYTSFPVVLAPVSVENESTVKVMVPDGSGGWKDVTSEVSEIPCSDFFVDFEPDLTGDTKPAIRFTSASEFDFIDPSDPVNPLLSGTYTRDGGNYTLNFESLLGITSIYGHATDGDFYTPMYAICNVTDDGTSRVEEAESGPIPSLNADLTEKYAGDTVVVQVFEVRYEE